MATKKNIEYTLDTSSVEDELAVIQLAIELGTFFENDNDHEVSMDLRYLQEFLNTVVTSRDKLAESKGIPRLVGKRGRKAGSSTPANADDIKAAMRKRAGR